MIDKIKIILGILICGLVGFYIISTSLISGKYIYDAFYREALTIVIEPERFAEQIAQSGYEFEGDEAGCSLRLKKEKGK